MCSHTPVLGTLLAQEVLGAEDWRTSGRAMTIEPDVEAAAAAVAAMVQVQVQVQVQVLNYSAADTAGLSRRSRDLVAT